MNFLDLFFSLDRILYPGMSQWNNDTAFIQRLIQCIYCTHYVHLALILFHCDRTPSTPLKAPPIAPPPFHTIAKSPTNPTGLVQLAVSVPDPHTKFALWDASAATTRQRTAARNALSGVSEKKAAPHQSPIVGTFDWARCDAGVCDLGRCLGRAVRVIGSGGMRGFADFRGLVGSRVVERVGCGINVG
jgi:hypothetical protein